MRGGEERWRRRGEEERRSGGGGAGEERIEKREAYLFDFFFFLTLQISGTAKLDYNLNSLTCVLPFVWTTLYGVVSLALIVSGVS